MKKYHSIIACVCVIFMFISAPASIAYSMQSSNVNDPDYRTISLDEYPNYASNQWYLKPKSYQQLVQWYQELEAQFPDYIEVFKANELYGTGKVKGDYDLYYVRITNESLGLHKPEVLFLGSPHGDESVGSIGLYWFTDWLMRKAYTDESSDVYDKDWLNWLVDNREIYIEVSHNPYGFDEVIRYDGHGWDLNREADYDGPGSPTGGIWASVPGKTLVRFINNHSIRVGCDFHGGIRLLIYPWASTYKGVNEPSPLTGVTYKGVPPDFYFFDAASLRLGDYIGDFGGNLDENRIGPVQDLINYEVKGGLTPWAYASNVQRHPQQDAYVRDELFGNYPGSGIFWVTPEISYVKNPMEINFGNDTVDGYGAEVRRFVLHQTDLAQPYVRWVSSIDPSETVTVETGESVLLSWQVNGSLVVDHTQLQWGTDPDPLQKYQFSSDPITDHQGLLLGGTGWDDAFDGVTYGVQYQEELRFDEPGDYHVVAKAQVDQAYGQVIHPEIYGDNSYLRLIQERTNASFVETIEGTDGVERITGQTWWYSPILHIEVRNNAAPLKPQIQTDRIGRPNANHSFSILVKDPDDDDIYVLIDWGDGESSGWIGPFPSGEPVDLSHQFDHDSLYRVTVNAKDTFDDESQPASVLLRMSKTKQKSMVLLPLDEIVFTWMFRLAHIRQFFGFP